MRAIIVAATLLLAASPAARGQQPASLQAGWKYLLESGSMDSTTRMEVMPPGWHFTTSAAGLWWDTTWVGNRKFAVEAEIHLFPDSHDAGFGVFIGGRDLNGRQPHYQSFQVTRSGTFIVHIRQGTDIHPHVPGRQHRSVMRPLGSNPVKNVLRVEAHPLRIDFFINDQKAYTLDRATVRADGVVGLRLGAGLSVHVSRFEVRPLE